MPGDEIISALIGLVGACGGNPKTVDTDRLLIAALAAPEDAAPEKVAAEVRAEKFRVSPGCAMCAMPCGNTSDYDMQRIYSAEQPVRELKLALIDKLREAARRRSGEPGDCEFFYSALTCLGLDTDRETLKALIRQAERV